MTIDSGPQEPSTDDDVVGASTPEIREWARRQGITLAQRGRLPAKVIELYLAAEGGEMATSVPAVSDGWLRSSGAPGEPTRPFDEPDPPTVKAARAPSRPEPAHHRGSPANIRDWAADHGMQLDGRLPVPAQIRRLHQHSTSPAATPVSSARSFLAFEIDGRRFVVEDGTIEAEALRAVLSPFAERLHSH